MSSMIELHRNPSGALTPWGMSQEWSLTMNNSKTCTRCGQILSVDNFSPNPKGRQGLRAECKKCRAEYTRNWSANNAEKKAAADKAYREANKDKVKETYKAWASQNKERIKETGYRWAKNNPEKSREIKRAWEQRNPDSRRAKVQRYRSRAANNETRLILAKEIKRLYSSPCFFCDSQERIEADHIIARDRGGRHSIGNLMPLCRSCNASKRDKTIMEFRIWKKRMGL